jgi:hypothetical protein
MNSNISEHANLKSKIDEIKQDNVKLEKRVHTLEEMIDQDRQRQNVTKLEIKGVPFQSGENLRSLVSRIGEVTGMKIEDEGIVDVRRFSFMKRDIQNGVDSPSIELTRQGIICVTFSSAELRGTYLKQTRNFNTGRSVPDKLNTSLLGMEKKIPIYVQEALTPRIRHIFMEAR